MKVLSAIALYLIILIYGFAAPATIFALAEGTENQPSTSYVTYGKAEVKDAYICSQPNEAYAMFAIPYTYCVEILGEEGDWYKVKYAEDSGIYRAVYGYCLKGQLKILYERPQIVYLYKPITVTYTADLPSTNLPVLGEITVTAAYYGAFYQGPAAYSYVLCDGNYGYITGANDDYPLNFDEPDEQNKDNNEQTPADVKLIIGVCLGVLAVAALLLLFFGNRKKPFTPHRD